MSSAVPPDQPAGTAEILPLGAVTMHFAGHGGMMLQRFASIYPLMASLLTQVDFITLMRAMGLQFEPGGDVPIAKVFDAHAALLRRLADDALEAAADFEAYAEEDRERTAAAQDIAKHTIAAAKRKGE